MAAPSRSWRTTYAVKRFPPIHGLRKRPSYHFFPAAKIATGKGGGKQMIEDRTWERLGALSGLGFIVLTLLATFLYPQQPRVDSAPAVTLAWVHNHRTGIQTGMVLGLFGAALLFWFIGHLRHVVHDEGLSPIMFGSGIGVAVLSAIAALPIGLLAFMDAQGGVTNPDVVRMLGDLNVVLFATTSAATMVFLIALGSVMVQREFVAPWLGWVSLLAAVLNGIHRHVDDVQHLPRRGVVGPRVGRVHRHDARHPRRERVAPPHASRNTAPPVGDGRSRLAGRVRGA